jgi:hypothetical protein
MSLDDYMKQQEALRQGLGKLHCRTRAAILSIASS